MDSEIQFGQLEETRPRIGIRPDRDRHYRVVPVGNVGDDLPIFVDLDTMRDMESHAREDTSVELGGVLLGFQSEDADGRPFVVVTDCLRARAYQATRGSFKFTHETWSQISRDRNEMAPDLEMVGWYHTHPGWGIFLSGMDMFICRHFFNRPLDLALVIDPCGNDRGWFQWDTAKPGHTRQAGGFYLMAHHTRAGELEYFRSLLAEPGADYVDPRYQDQTIPWLVANGGIPAPNALVQSSNGEAEMVDSRRWLFELAVLTSLALQLFLVALIAWRLVGVGASGVGLERPLAADDQTSAEVGRRDNSDVAAEQLSRQVREATLYELLVDLAAQRGEDPSLARMLADSRREQARLEQNLEGQLARVEMLTRELQDAQRLARQWAAAHADLQAKLAAEEEKYAQLQREMAGLNEPSQDGGQRTQDSLGATEWFSGSPINRWLPWLGGVLLVIIGLSMGYFWGVRSLPQDDWYPMGSGASDEPDASDEQLDDVRFGYGAALDGEGDHSEQQTHAQAHDQS